MSPHPRPRSITSTLLTAAVAVTATVDRAVAVAGAGHSAPTLYARPEGGLPGIVTDLIRQALTIAAALGHDLVQLASAR